MFRWLSIHLRRLYQYFSLSQQLQYSCPVQVCKLSSCNNPSRIYAPQKSDICFLLCTHNGNDIQRPNINLVAKLVMPLIKKCRNCGHIHRSAFICISYFFQRSSVFFAVYLMGWLHSNWYVWLQSVYRCIFRIILIIQCTVTTLYTLEHLRPRIQVRDFF